MFHPAVLDRSDEPTPMFVLGGAVLLALVSFTATALARPSRTWSFAVLASAVLWPFVNARWEGPVLWVPLPGHGLTLGDLITPLAIATVAGGGSIRRRATGGSAR